MLTKTNKARRIALMLVVFMLFSLVGSAGAIDSDNGKITIDPDENIIILNYGEEFSETVTVSVPPGAAVSKADVYLLADTTGSMGGPIASVKAGATAIVDDLIDEFPEVDIQFGVGDFKDFPYDTYCFKHAVSITDNTDAVKTAINAWSASGGVDIPEGQFFAYDQLAEDNDPANGTIGWREGSKKILVVFGDAPSHDPIPPCIGTGLDYTITEASVTAKLVETGITFIGISTTTGVGSAMDAAPYAGDYLSSGLCPGYVNEGTAGQATRIAAATGGVHLMGISSTVIVEVMREQISAAVTTINNLSLVPAGDIAPFVTSISPASYGPLDSALAHELEFEVTFTGIVDHGDEDQVFEGRLDVLADGTMATYKPVQITVPAGEAAAGVIEITKSGPSSATAGRSITYSFTVENTGDVELFDVVVTDPLFGGGWEYMIGSLGVGEEYSFSQTYSIPSATRGSLVNTALVTGYYEDEVEVEVEAENGDKTVVEDVYGAENGAGGALADGNGLTVTESVYEPDEDPIFDNGTEIIMVKVIDSDSHTVSVSAPERTTRRTTTPTRTPTEPQPQEPVDEEQVEEEPEEPAADPQIPVREPEPVQEQEIVPPGEEPLAEPEAVALEQEEVETTRTDTLPRTGGYIYLAWGAGALLSLAGALLKFKK